MATGHSQETRMRILFEQLNRAYAALAHHRRARMRSMSWGSTLMLILLLLGFTKWMVMAALALPFVAIYLVVQYGCLTHLITYHRAVVAELESKINHELGETLLVGASLEAKLCGPVGQSHFLGLSAGNLTCLFSIATIHYLVICLLMFLAGALRTQYVLKHPELRPVDRFGDIYAPFLLLWALANILYLIWYYVKGEQEKDLLAAIRKECQPKSE